MLARAGQRMADVSGFGLCQLTGLPVGSSVDRNKQTMVRLSSREVPRVRRGRSSQGMIVRASFFDEVIRSEPLMTATAGFLTGQLLKPITSADSSQFNWRLLFKSGGMPSSHSSTVCAMATGIYFKSGGDSSDFALALIFACIVMYDAQGVRRAAGKQAEVLNSLVVPILAKPEVGHSTARGATSTREGNEIEGSSTNGGSNGAGVEQRQLVGALERAQGSSMESSGVPMSSSTQSSSRLRTSVEGINDGGKGAIEGKAGTGGEWQRGPLFWDAAKQEPSFQAGDVLEQEIGQLEGWRHIPLKESIGHTKKQVIAGALTGVLLGNIVHAAFFA